jgi:hypothetical protein
MRNYLSILTIVLTSAQSLFAQQPVRINVSKDYAKTGAIAINGKTIPSKKLLDQLMMLAIHQGESIALEVILPILCGLLTGITCVALFGRLDSTISDFSYSRARPGKWWN